MRCPRTSVAGVRSSGLESPAYGARVARKPPSTRRGEGAEVADVADGRWTAGRRRSPAAPQTAPAGVVPVVAVLLPRLVRADSYRPYGWFNRNGPDYRGCTALEDLVSGEGFVPGDNSGIVEQPFDRRTTPVSEAESDRPRTPDHPTTRVQRQRASSGGSASRDNLE